MKVMRPSNQLVVSWLIVKYGGNMNIKRKRKEYKKGELIINKFGKNRTSPDKYELESINQAHLLREKFQIYSDSMNRMR